MFRVKNIVRFILFHIYRLFVFFYRRFDTFIQNEELNYKKREFKKFGQYGKIVKPFYIANPQYISIGDNFTSLADLRLEAIDHYYDQRFQPEIVIGDNVIFNSDCHIGCIQRVSIGNNVLLASRVFISDHGHGKGTEMDTYIPPRKRDLFCKGPVIIEDNVWIGEGVAILSGVHIGKNSIIGANSVVTKNIGANCVAAGVPARIVRHIV